MKAVAWRIESQRTAAHVSGFLQRDGKAESSQENPGEAGEVRGASNRCLLPLSQASFILTYSQASCLFPPIDLGGYVAGEAAAPISSQYFLFF